jgi:hypothetical protein
MPTSEFYAECPSGSGKSFTPIDTETSNSYQINGTILVYRIFCGANLADYRSGWNRDVSDLQMIYSVTTLDNCITMCASYNFALSTSGNSNPPWQLLCSGVTYMDSNGTSSDPVRCVLKSGLRNNATNVLAQPICHSAILQWAGESL